jgi:ribonuclease BN (tRNA processing enzyme)
MQVTVLGCAGSISAGHHTTSFLVDDDLLIDAGSGVGTLELPALQRIQHVVLSHSHLDHVLALPLLADAVIRHRMDHGLGPLQVHALPQTLQVLREDLFNNRLWPDFTRLPDPRHPFIALHEIQEGDVLSLGHHRVLALPARHVVPAVGYAVWDGRRADAPVWAYSGDTGPNPAVWPVLHSLPGLRHWVIEVAFSNADAELARLSGHHCPRSLDDELDDLPPTVEVHITHLKPGEGPMVKDELAQRGLRRPLKLLQHGHCFQL